MLVKLLSTITLYLSQNADSAEHCLKTTVKKGSINCKACKNLPPHYKADMQVLHAAFYLTVLSTDQSGGSKREY